MLHNCHYDEHITYKLFKALKKKKTLTIFKNLRIITVYINY